MNERDIGWKKEEKDGRKEYCKTRREVNERDKRMEKKEECVVGKVKGGQKAEVKQERQNSKETKATEMKKRRDGDKVRERREGEERKQEK